MIRPSIWDVVVIGGGPAGFFAAIRCAQLRPSYKILMLERSSQLLSKVRISGGGRCNVMHACYDPAELLNYYPRGGQELHGPFTYFQPADTAAWFESHGVPLKTEPDGRIFPTSDSSASIVDCLVEQAEKSKVVMRTRLPVRSIARIGKKSIFKISTDGDESFLARRVLLATGGTRNGFHLAQSLGHTIELTVPSLFTFTITDPRLDGLAGVSVEDVCLSLPESAIEQSGALLITHWGLSGPAVLKLSAWGARPLHNANYQADLLIDWLPGYAAGALQITFLEKKSFSAGQLVTARSISDTSVDCQPLPLRLWRKLVYAAGIGARQTWGDLSRSQFLSLANELTHGQYRISGKGAFKEEFVTCGGINLKEVDFKTMQSRVCRSLYLAGEVLDIDALTGGFNFQAAWTTGWLAGSAMAEK
jgi:predicted Rossmann fold flavoprotein